jgi:hypothetical protein
VIGHPNVSEQLTVSLPSVSLFYGPRSVGKLTCGKEALAGVGAQGSDLREITRLDAESARQVVSFFSVRPLNGCKAVLMQTDGATTEAFNALLKVLEEPPPRAYVVMVATKRPPLTVCSRAREFRFGYLTEDEVAEVLVSVYGWDLDDAEKAAARSGGQVDVAVGWAEMEREHKGAVLQVLKGTADGNVELILNALSGKRDGRDVFGAEEFQLLRRWAVEARTRRWRIFTPAEGFGLQLESRVVDRVLGACASGARPKVATRAALLPVAMERSQRVG